MWLQSYLLGRQQQILVDRNIYLKLGSVENGVPQGTVLGPLLFIIYMKDIGESIRSYINASLLLTTSRFTFRSRPQTLG